MHILGKRLILSLAIVCASLVPETGMAQAPVARDKAIPEASILESCGEGIGQWLYDCPKYLVRFRVLETEARKTSYDRTQSMLTEECARVDKPQRFDGRLLQGLRSEYADAPSAVCDAATWWKTQKTWQDVAAVRHRVTQGLETDVTVRNPAGIKAYADNQCNARIANCECHAKRFTELLLDSAKAIVPGSQSLVAALSQSTLQCRK